MVGESETYGEEDKSLARDEWSVLDVGLVAEEGQHRARHTRSRTQDGEKCGNARDVVQPR